MAANAKEARRRKILERGSDRLALITGRIQTRPPSSVSSPSSLSQPSDADADSSSRPLIIDGQVIPPLIPPPNTTVFPQDEAEESDPILLKPDPVTDPYHSNAYNSSSQTLPLPELEHKNQISNVPTSEVEQVQPPPGPSVVSSEVDQVQPPPESSVSPQDEAEESDTILLKSDPTTDPYHSNAYGSSGQTPPLHELEHKNQISNVPTSEVELVQPPSGSSVVSSETDQVQLPPDSSGVISGTEQRSQLQSWDPKFFTLGEISSAITASKITRLCCSIVVALLVVLSYLGFPLLDNKYVKSILNFRPLYLVLVTNVTVVVAQLLSGKQRSSERAGGRQNKIPSDGDYWAEHLGRALEAGLVMRNVIDAMFMDCASYAIIVICGLSIVQLFSK